jgi:hypothetical protein
VPPLPTDPVEVERAVRGALVQLFKESTGLEHVYGARVYVDDETDLVRRFGYQVNGRTELRGLIIDFAGFEETDRGCDDDPIYRLLYDLRLVVSYAQRAVDTTSTDDFAAIVMRMRSACMQHRVVGGIERTRLNNLETRQVLFGRDTETLILGHIGLFRVSVEIVPYG